MDLFSLKEKKGLITGIANDQSIAYGCARIFRKAGAQLAITYLNEKAKPYVQPLAEQLESRLFLPLDVRQDGQLESVYNHIEASWGELDFVLHSIAYAPKEDLHRRVVDCSKEGFSMAMDISCHSFIRMAHYAEPLMKNGGCLLTMSFFGAEKVVEDYNLMGPVKAALESVTKYMAAELGRKKIRVHAISPGPLQTRAASGISRFDELLEKYSKRAPYQYLVDIKDVGNTAAFLISDAASALTGNVTYVDSGYHIIG